MRRKRPARPRVKLNRDAVWALLDELGISQNELARQCGLSPGYLSLLMAGKRSPSPHTRRRQVLLTSNFPVGVGVFWILRIAAWAGCCWTWECFKAALMLDLNDLWAGQPGLTSQLLVLNQHVRRRQSGGGSRGDEALSADRLLLGSDYRLLWAKRVKEQARGALGEEAAQSVLHANAQRLLGL